MPISGIHIRRSKQYQLVDLPLQILFIAENGTYLEQLSRSQKTNITL
jgi:hypothetical protein